MAGQRNDGIKEQCSKRRKKKKERKKKINID